MDSAAVPPSAVHAPAPPAGHAYALAVEFDGGGFCGTQVQGKGERTLHAVLAAAVERLDGAPVHLRLASRLDTGVSASWLTADVRLRRQRDPALILSALNGNLPRDVAVRAVAPVAAGFNAIGAASGKTYVYRLSVRPVRLVLDRTAWWLRELDHPERLAELAALIRGRHDLSGFACLRHNDSDAADPVRTITAAEWSLARLDGAEEWTLRLSGTGFLYKQIRGLVGAMVHVAGGRASVEDFRRLMAAGRNAVKFANVAPAEGLRLERVAYDPEPAWVSVPLATRAPAR